MFIIRLSVSTGCRKQPTIIPEGGRVGLYGAFLFIYQKDSKQSYQPELCICLNKPYQRFRSEVSEQI